MATGPEHYMVAERTLDEVVSGVYPDDQQVTWALAKAQVHATLALAAATALLVPEQDTYPDLNPWSAVMGRSAVTDPGAGS